MSGAIDDAMLDSLAPQGSYSEIADILREAYGGLAARINFPVPDDPAHDREAARAIATLRESA